MPFGAGSFLGNGDLLVDRPGGTYALDPDQQATGGSTRAASERSAGTTPRSSGATRPCSAASRDRCRAPATYSPAALPASTRSGSSIRRRTSRPTAARSSSPIRLGRRAFVRSSTSASGNRIDIGRLEAIYSPDPWTTDGSGVVHRGRRGHALPDGRPGRTDRSRPLRRSPNWSCGDRDAGRQPSRASRALAIEPRSSRSSCCSRVR